MYDTVRCRTRLEEVEKRMTEVCGFMRAPCLLTELEEAVRDTNNVSWGSQRQSLQPGRGRPTSSFVLSAIILWKPIPTPSITAKKTPHMMAEFRAALNPPRMARAPPVQKPAMTVTNNGC